MTEHQWKELSKYFLDNGNRKLFTEEKEVIKLTIDQVTKGSCWGFFSSEALLKFDFLHEPFRYPRNIVLSGAFLYFLWDLKETFLVYFQKKRLGKGERKRGWKPLGGCGKMRRKRKNLNLQR